MSGVFGDVEHLVAENVSMRTRTPAAVASQLVLTVSLSIVVIFAFNILRLKYKNVYQPKVTYYVGRREPPDISTGFWGWLPPLWFTKEDEIFRKVGFDAVMYLRFLRMLRWLFTSVAVLAAGVLIPINVLYNIRHVDSSARDVLSILTIRNVSGSILFVHVGMTYAFTFLVMAFVWWHWRAMVRLRHEWLNSPEYLESFHARTLMVRKVPRPCRTDEGIRALLDLNKADSVDVPVHISHKLGRLPKLVNYHNNAVRKLEDCLVGYLKNDMIGKQRPTIHRGGFLGIGELVDAINFWTTTLRRDKAEVTKEREAVRNRKPESYGFASMATAPQAHVLAHRFVEERPQGTIISLAPVPHDIIWENLKKTEATLIQRRIIGWIHMVAFCSLNTIPLFIVSFLANLAAITSYVRFLQDWANDNNASFAIVSGILPALVSTLFGSFLPDVMRWLSKWNGATTYSELDRAVVARYFAFLLISQLIIFTLIGVIFNSAGEIVQQIGDHESLTEIVQNLNALPGTINSTYINQSTFWLTFFPLRFFLVVLDLTQIPNLIWISVKQKLFGRTPRNYISWSQPRPFEYAVYYPNMLFVAAVGLVFAPLAPLVVVAAAVVFWISSIVYKYHLMYIFESRVETGGHMWNLVINRLLVGVVFMQALMILTIGLQLGFGSFKWVASVPPILFIIAFKLYLNKTLDRQFREASIDSPDHLSAQNNALSDTNPDYLVKEQFGHPALHTALLTPMVHDSMWPLLSQVYEDEEKTVASVRLEEYGNIKVKALVLHGDIQIAAIKEKNLKYDPGLYRRERELEFDPPMAEISNIEEKRVQTLTPNPYPDPNTPYSRPTPESLPHYSSYKPSAMSPGYFDRVYAEDAKASPGESPQNMQDPIPRSPRYDEARHNEKPTTTSSGLLHKSISHERPAPTPMQRRTPYDNTKSGAHISSPSSSRRPADTERAM